MGFLQRTELRNRWESLRGSKLICYLTQTRSNTNFQIAMDVVPRLNEHIRHASVAARAKPRIDLLIHSNGGDGVVPWRLVTLLREYSRELNVVIPNRAFSAATLVALGADSIVMHPMGMLGPTDPTVANAFNPTDPANAQNRLGISVEDVYSYIALIKDDVGIKGESEAVQAFRTLTEQVHPLALGNVKRFYAQSRMMAKKLLSLHMSSKSDHSIIAEIADNLTSKLYFHGHPINRAEARELGLKVKMPKAAEEAALWDLYRDFRDEMQLDTDFILAQDFMRKAGGFHKIQAGTPVVADLDPLVGAIVESGLGCHVFSQELVATGVKQPTGQVQVNASLVFQGWRFREAADFSPAQPPS